MLFQPFSCFYSDQVPTLDGIRHNQRMHFSINSFIQNGIPLAYRLTRNWYNKSTHFHRMTQFHVQPAVKAIVDSKSIHMKIERRRTSRFYMIFKRARIELSPNERRR